jgi:hypothetical protein
MQKNVAALTCTFSTVKLPQVDGLLENALQLYYDGIITPGQLGFNIKANLEIKEIYTGTNHIVLESLSRFIFLTDELTRRDATWMINTAMIKLKTFDQAQLLKIDHLLALIDIGRSNEINIEVDIILDWFYNNI